MEINITKEQEGKGLPRDYCFRATAGSLQDTNKKTAIQMLQDIYSI